MYIRLTSRRFPSDVLTTDNEWSISKDKSGALILADEEMMVAPILIKRHAVHVTRNPALGHYFEIVTEDNGLFNLPPIPKSKLEIAKDLEWHYKIYFVRVDIPFSEG